MRLRHSRFAAAVSVLLISAATAASATVLWDQSNWNTNNEGSLNIASNACSQISGNTRLFNAMDVTFAQPVNINTITLYETPGNVQTATQAYLWIGPKTGPLPTVNSFALYNAANLKTITSSVVATGVVAVTATNLNISLPAGSYWVAMAPRHNLGIYPYTVHLVTSGPVVGDPTPTIEACTDNTNWLFVLDPNRYDYAFKIEGDFPVPANSSSWGKLKMLYR
jgi:hypothetical protein